MTTHLRSKSREYKVWQRIKAYCYCFSSPPYKKYGAKGITMCSTWKDDFNKFFIDMGEMPELSNGLVLKEGFKEFNKHTCVWAWKKVGRPRKTEIVPTQKRTKRIKFQHPRSICLVLEKQLLETIKAQAMAKSIQEGIFIEPNDLIRDAIKKAFPYKMQSDMFEK